MKRFFAIIFILVMATTIAFAEGLDFIDIQKCSGILYSMERIDLHALWEKDEELWKNIHKSNIDINGKTLELEIYRITQLNTDETAYAIEFYYKNIDDIVFITKYIDRNEFALIINGLERMRQIYDEVNNGAPSNKQIYYTSKDGVKFSGGSYRLLRIAFDENNFMDIEDIDAFDKLLNYVSNAEKVIETLYE